MNRGGDFDGQFQDNLFAVACNKMEKLDSDLLREIAKSVAELLMSHEDDMRCNAPYGQKAAGHTNHCMVTGNGDRTRAGSIIELEFGPIDFLAENRRCR